VILARRGLSDGSLIEQANFLPVYGCFALIAADLDEVVPLLDTWIAVAHRRGSVFALAPAQCFRGVAWLSQGALAEAEANLRDAMWAVTTTSQRVGAPVIAAYLADTLMEQGNLHEAEAVLDKAVNRSRCPELVTGPGCAVAGPASTAYRRARGWPAWLQVNTKVWHS